MLEIPPEGSDTITLRGQRFKVDMRAGVLRNVRFALDTIRFQDLEQMLIDEALRGDRKTQDRCIETAARLDKFLGREPGSGCGRLLDAINATHKPPAEHRIERGRDRRR